MNIEKYNESLFESISVDSLMKKCNIPENQAIEKLYEMYTSINVFNPECLVEKGYYSIRYAVMNRMLMN